MKTEFCVHFTRHYTRGKLLGLNPRSSLVFPTLESARKWIDHVRSNCKLDYVVRDMQITEIAIAPDPLGFHELPRLPRERPVTPQGEAVKQQQEQKLRPARKLAEDDHQARWCRWR